MVQRQVKDRVFTLLFSTKEAQLELYNAMNNTHYTDSNDLEVVTLENALYMSMKNDVSFLLHNQLSFYEQQSTINPNMPLRQLFYVTEQYKRMFKSKRIYGSTLVNLPRPQFIVLYNGVRKAPERQVLRLSDAYYDRGTSEQGEEIGLELITTVININHGYNETIKTRSTLLGQYGQFVDAIHRYQQEYPIREALKQAIEYCIKNGILQEFLERERDAVMSSILYEYDEEETLAYIAEEQYGLGEKNGIAKGITQGDSLRILNQMIKKVQKSKSLDVIAEELECEPEEIQKFYDAIVCKGAVCSAEEILAELTGTDTTVQGEK